MNYYESLTKSVEEGLSGESAGIPFSLDRLNNTVPGIQKSRIAIVAGATGSGKSKVLNELFMFRAVDDWIESNKSYPLYIYN